MRTASQEKSSISIRKKTFSAKRCVFAMPGFDTLAQRLAKSIAGAWAHHELQRFSNKEMQLQLKEEVSGKQVFVVGTVAPPVDNVMELLMLIHTLKKEQALKIVLVLPYFAYLRQDKNEHKKAQGAKFLADTLGCVGVDRIITIDAHSQRAVDHFSGALVSLPSTELFAREIKKQHLKQFTIVAPDEGAISRAAAISRALGKKQAVTYFVKKRQGRRVSMTLNGAVSQQVIIIDDMLDTGGTLIECCKILKKKGVSSIFIMVTHGLFTGEKWKQLWDLGVKRIYVTDTIPGLKRKVGKIKNIIILPTATLLRDYMKKT